MKSLFRRMSLVSRGLRYKLMIAFSLMSIIPLLVCGYLVNIFIFPHLESMLQVSIIVFLSVTIALLGLVLAKRMISPIVDMSLEAKIIAGGDFKRKVTVDTDDEVGELGKSINLITKKIKDSMVELQNYSVKTREVNLEIQKKVLALSNLLQIGDMIAASQKLEDVMKLIVEKAGAIDEDSSTVLFLAEAGTTKMLPKFWDNINKKAVKDLAFTIDRDYLGVSIQEKKPIRIDSSAKSASRAQEIRNIFKKKNYLIIPVVSHGSGMGFLLVANDKEGFIFKEDDIELVKVLSKQLGIAIENDTLLRKTKELTIKDELTGLYNEKYIKDRLDEEIRRAILFQRPCSLLLFNIDNFMQYRDTHGEMITEKSLKRIAAVLKDTSTPVSKVARLGGDEFAVLLPEKNKKEATLIAEDIRKRIEAEGSKLAKKGEHPLTVSGSVSENPIDGATAKELFDKAAQAVKKAKLEGKNRIST